MVEHDSEGVNADWLTVDPWVRNLRRLGSTAALAPCHEVGAIARQGTSIAKGPRSSAKFLPVLAK
jgi:hypothetical protein